MAGIVNYAKYLRVSGRGRSTLVREAGIDQNNLKGQGFVFAVRHVVADYLAPARMDDMLRVETKLASVGRTKIVFDQRVFRDEKMLFSSEVSVVFMSLAGRPTRLSDEIKAKLQQFAA